MNINVTRPFLPPILEYQSYVDEIWRRNWLTNNGPYVNELELKLKEFLGINHLAYVANGTLSLQLALKTLPRQGEIITTPFSYVATCSSIVWEGFTPVFVDILPTSLNIDPNRIDAAVTSKTVAILATHVYGNPCDVDGIDAIAKRHGLTVIYDAAHAFGVRLRDKSLYDFGDMSTASFHATKVFHTIEGGAVITKQPEVMRKIILLRNFGHISPTEFDGVGINAKNSEFHAAMGLCNLKYISDIIKRRQVVSGRYDRNLGSLSIRKPQLAPGTDYNFSYYPVIFDRSEILHAVLGKLNAASIFPRRYFYPSLDRLSYVVARCPVPHSNDIADRILCLPLYDSLKSEEVDLITRIIHRTLKYDI